MTVVVRPPTQIHHHYYNFPRRSHSSRTDTSSSSSRYHGTTRSPGYAYNKDRHPRSRSTPHITAYSARYCSGPGWSGRADLPLPRTRLRAAPCRYYADFEPMNNFDYSVASPYDGVDPAGRGTYSGRADRCLFTTMAGWGGTGRSLYVTKGSNRCLCTTMAGWGGRNLYVTKGSRNLRI